ncbi:MAG: sulfotransferase domain-containing protein [Gammaproteobacteria bacterium]|nr:sulfotransferase domain-containing protein [Gammaproteobacteria bacterium]
MLDDEQLQEPGDTPSLPRHAGAAEIRARLDPDCWKSYLKCAFIRNPWEMRVAEFLSTRGKPPASMTPRAAQGETQSAFEDFMLSPERSRLGYSDYLCDSSGELLLDFVGRYESLERDMAVLFERLGLNADYRDRPAFEPVADYASYFNFLTRDLVASEFQADLEPYAYRFDPSASGGVSVLSRRQAPAHLIAHFSHHKAGTVWFQRVLKKLAERQGWKFQSCLQQDLESGTHIFTQENSRVELELLPQYRASHIIRDPRDMVVSGYFYHLWCEEPWCLAKRDRFGGRSYQQALNSVSREQGITMEIERCQSTFDSMSQWDYRRPELIEVRFEEMLANQYAVFERVFAHYGLSARQVEIGLSLAEQCDFERTTGRKKGQEAEQSHLRKGVAGDWRNHFADAHVKQFKSSYPGLLAGLGYEAGDDW